MMVNGLIQFLAAFKKLFDGKELIALRHVLLLTVAVVSIRGRHTGNVATAEI